MSNAGPIVDAVTESPEALQMVVGSHGGKANIERLAKAPGKGQERAFRCRRP